MGGKEQNELGLSLLEICIVLCVLSSLLVIATPRVHLFSFLLQSEAEKIRQELMWSKQSAIVHNKPYKVEFRTNLDCFRISAFDYQERRYVLEKELTLTHGVDMIATNLKGFPYGRVIFYPREYGGEGIPTVSSGGKVILKQGNQVRFVIITPVTGRVRVDEGCP